MRRPVNETFRYLAHNPGYAAEDPGAREPLSGGRTHYFTDCWQITGNGCIARQATPEELDPERALCWSCVSRLVEIAES